MKQGTRFGGRNKPLVSCEMLLSSHKPLLRMDKLIFCLYFPLTMFQILYAFLFGHFCATCLDYAQYK